MIHQISASTMKTMTNSTMMAAIMDITTMSIGVSHYRRETVICCHAEVVYNLHKFTSRSHCCHRPPSTERQRLGSRELSRFVIGCPQSSFQRHLILPARKLDLSSDDACRYGHAEDAKRNATASMNTRKKIGILAHNPARKAM